MTDRGLSQTKKELGTGVFAIVSLKIEIMLRFLPFQEMNVEYWFATQHGFCENLVIGRFAPLGFFTSFTPLLVAWFCRQWWWPQRAKTEAIATICMSGLCSAIFSAWLSNLSGFMDVAFMYWVLWDLVSLPLKLRSLQHPRDTVLKIAAPLLRVASLACVFLGLFLTEATPSANDYVYALCFVVPVILILVQVMFLEFSLPLVLGAVACVISATLWVLSEPYCSGAESTDQVQPPWHLYLFWGRALFHLSLYSTAILVVLRYPNVET